MLFKFVGNVFPCGRIVAPPKFGEVFFDASFWNMLVRQLSVMLSPWAELWLRPNFGKCLLVQFFCTCFLKTNIR